jgi:hypothetical protein
MSVGLSGLTPNDFTKDPLLADVFKDTVGQVAGTTVASTDVRNVLASDPGPDSASTVKVTFSIKMTTAGQQPTVKQAFAAGITDGTFTSQYQQNLQTSSVTSVDVDKVTADNVEHEVPDSGPDDGSADTTNDGGGDGGGGGGGGGGGIMFSAIGGVMFLGLVAGAIWYFKFRKPSSGSMKKLTSQQDVMNPAAQFQSSSNVELEAPMQNDGGPVMTINSSSSDGDGAAFVDK